MANALLFTCQKELPHSVKISLLVNQCQNRTLMVQHKNKDSRSHPYSGADTVVEAVHLLCELVQLQGANPQDLNPEVVWVLMSRNINLKMFIGLEAQVWAGNWTTHRGK